MATQNVRFYFGTQLKYDQLAEKNPLALYFIEDTKRLYKGDVLIATGEEASDIASGLMSSKDKIALDNLVASGGGIGNLQPVDGSIIITDGEGGKKNIGVAISTQDGNALTVVDGGLFVPSAQEVLVPEYVIEKQETANEGFAATYKLKKTVGDEVTYVGDAINIAKDLVLQSASMQTVTEDNIPYDGAVIGDPYIEMIFNDEPASTLYIPMKGLVDTYTAGDGIEVVDGKISVKVASDSHGLVAVDGAMTMLLASSTQDGAMSKEDKVFIDTIPETYATIDRVKKTTTQVKYNISATPEGTLVNYGEKEIRIMCPADAVFTKQNVGDGGDANSYYVTFKTYVPNENAVGYIEHLGDKVDAEILTNFSVDEYGRRYQSTWLAIAKYDEATGIWNYYGKNSSANTYAGWDYQIDWYNADGVKIASDSIRINLSNEGCHNVMEPYYISALEAKFDSISESYTWGEL